MTPSRSLTTDQRGIALQTLVVTAVLVLMAVAAGCGNEATTDNAQDDPEDQVQNTTSTTAVKPTAVKPTTTNTQNDPESQVQSTTSTTAIKPTTPNAQDNPESQVQNTTSTTAVKPTTTNAQDNPEDPHIDIEPRCEPWEIYDATLAADGRGGGNGGIYSSGEGCLRVCYVRGSTNGFDISSDASKTIVPPGTPALNARLEFVMSRNDIATAVNTYSSDSTAAKRALVVMGRNSLTLRDEEQAIHELSGEDDRIGHDARRPRISDLKVDSDGDGSGAAIDFDEDTMIIKVAPSQNYCHIWNTTTDEEIIRSSRE